MSAARIKKGVIRQWAFPILVIACVAAVIAQEEPSIARVPQLSSIFRPQPQQPAVGLESDQHLDKTTPRKTKGLDLIKMGWTYNCMECHRSLESKWNYGQPMVEHEGVVLNHGNNRFCLNCHHPDNRNAFVDYDGSEIAEEDVVLLCAKCHGPKYRDWKAGAHGRQNGYWNSAKGTQTRLRCIQCHDPHSPQFKKMEPLTAPAYPKRAAGAALRLGLDHSDSH